MMYKSKIYTFYCELIILTFPKCHTTLRQALAICLPPRIVLSINWGGQLRTACVATALEQLHVSSWSKHFLGKTNQDLNMCIVQSYFCSSMICYVFLSIYNIHSITFIVYMRKYILYNTYIIWYIYFFSLLHIYVTGKCSILSRLICVQKATKRLVVMELLLSSNRKLLKSIKYECICEASTHLPSQKI